MKRQSKYEQRSFIMRKLLWLRYMPLAYAKALWALFWWVLAKMPVPPQFKYEDGTEVPGTTRANMVRITIGHYTGFAWIQMGAGRKLSEVMQEIRDRLNENSK